jgi:hypothetical protein
MPVLPSRVIAPRRCPDTQSGDPDPNAGYRSPRGADLDGAEALSSSLRSRHIVQSSVDRTVILIDPGLFSEAATKITSLVPSARSMIASPLLVAASDDPGLRELTGIAGIVAVTAADSLEFNLLTGIDWAIQLNLGLLPALAVGGVTPGEDYPAAFEEPHGSVAPYAICAAVNFSLTPPDDDVAPTLPGDPINHATRTLSGYSVPVCAAGNHHVLGASFETMSPWAEPDWVLSVGATSDEAGEVEWPRSGRGSVRRPGVGPDILAWGQDSMSAAWFGTSFAAARVSRMMVWTRAWLLQVLANIDRFAGGSFGVPLVGAAVVDRHAAPKGLGPPAFGWAALPVIGTQAGALESLSEVERRQLGELLAWPAGHYAARAVLQAAAVETSPRPAIALSAPSLTPARLAVFVDELSAPALLKLVGSANTESGRGDDPKPVPLFPRGTLQRVVQLVTSSQPAWEFDVDQAKGRTRQASEEGA